jgi:RNase P/RNase MRP subunit p29
MPTAKWRRHLAARVKRTVPKLEGPARAVARQELVGRAVRIADSTDPGLVGLEGTVVDESLRTLSIRRPDGREVRVGKRESVFDFGGVRVPGAAIEFRSEDRTKKVR